TIVSTGLSSFGGRGVGNLDGLQGRGAAYLKLAFTTTLGSLSYPQPTSLGEFCKPWPHLEPQPLRWRLWSCRSTRGRWVKSRKSFRSSRRLPARQRSATPSSRHYPRRSASP